ncbi:MAG: serine hydrolase [Parafannyhessea sp.]|uniref:serine hydrolase n=1 Tax=Parafannyhessea sp. TaxID=2847324 RepID=UPI003F001013
MTARHAAPQAHGRHGRHEAPRERGPRRGHKAVAIVLLALVAAAVAAVALVPQVRGALFPTATHAATKDAASSTDASTSAKSAASAKVTTAATDASSSAGEKDDSSSSSSQPSEDTSALDASASAKVTTFTTSGGISVTAPDGFANTPTCKHLEDAVAAFTAKGYHLGFSMVDLKTGRGVSYNADQKFYPASSIKAIYCTAILESTNGGAASSSDTITKCLVDSDNDSFRALLKTYGYTVYGNWLKSRAPEAAQEAYTYNYPHISATGMLNCWKEIYRYGTSGEAGASLLTGCLAKTNHSALGALLRSRYTVWAKPGWYPTNEGLASTATAEGAIVFSDCGDYAIAVLSDAPSDFDSLLPVLDALNAAHGKMCGGSSALRQTSSTTVG